MNKNRRRAIAYLVIALVLACAGSYLALTIIQNANAQVQSIQNQYGPQVYTIVAAKSLPARTTLTLNSLDDGTLRLEKRPALFVPPSAFQIPEPGDMESAAFTLNEGLDGFTLIPLNEGDIVLPNMIETSYVIPPKMRAVSMAVNPATSVSGYLRAGDRVDVIASYEAILDANNKEPRTVVLLQNVPILSVSWENNIGATSDITATNGLTQTLVLKPGLGELIGEEDMARDTIVTLALSLDDSQKLAYMQNFGKEIRLVLRRQDDPDVLTVPTLAPPTFR